MVVVQSYDQGPRDAFKYICPVSLPHQGPILAFAYLFYLFPLFVSILHPHHYHYHHSHILHGIHIYPFTLRSPLLLHSTMEFSSSNPDPMIFHPGYERQWGHEHVPEDTLRWTETKQADSFPLRRSSVLSIKRRASQPDVLRRVEKRQRVNKPVITTKQRSHFEKSRSAADWEHLLKSSLQSLQGLYARIDVPAALKSQVLGDRTPLGLVDHSPALMASKAMHHAAGCCNEGGPNDDESYDSSSSEAEDSSDSDDAFEGPATPNATRFDAHVDIDIDIDFSSNGHAGVPSHEAYTQLR